MNKQFYFLSPVEVVKVTSQNLEEVAEWCGGSVQKTESRRVPGRMDSYVLVPTPKDTNISWAFPGMFITKRLVVTVKDELRSTFAVFRRDYFEKNYFETPKQAADKTWEREVIEKSKPPKRAEVNVQNNVGQALIQAQAELARVEEDLRQKKADRIMLMKSDIELEQLVKDGHITTNDVRRHKGLPVLEIKHNTEETQVVSTDEALDPKEELSLENPEDAMDLDPKETSVVHRDAKTGEFVTEKYAEENPDTTVSETVEVSS